MHIFDALCDCIDEGEGGRLWDVNVMGADYLEIEGDLLH